MNDAALIAELAPTAGDLLDRHLATAKEWFPHELVPWGRGRDFKAGERFDPDDAGVDPAVRSALLVNLLTEDNLPYYSRNIANAFGPADVWASWNRRWTAEEGRHSIVIRDYLTVTRSIDLRELERTRMIQVSSGLVPNPPSIKEGLVYVALQELATRIAHRNTGKLLQDDAGQAIMSRVAADENLHHLFYRDLDVGRARDRPVRDGRRHRASGADVRDAGGRHPRLPAARGAIASAGVYDFASHHDQILVPVIFKHWRIEHLQNLKSAAEQARERLVHHVERVGTAARRMKARLARRPATVL